jgi:Fe-S cluster assembly iron-binding protein IscA
LNIKKAWWSKEYSRKECYISIQERWGINVKCKINRNAAKILNRLLNEPERKGKYVRVVITEVHGDSETGHAHYAITFDDPTEHDEIVQTDKGIPVLMDKRDEEWLDGAWIQFFYVPNEKFEITNINPSKSNAHHH